jgi:paraquat-inducible protein B
MTRNSLLAGSFVIAALVLIVAGVLTLSGGSLFSQRLKATVFFEGSVRGLYVGAPVTFRGVKMGEVETIAVEVDPRTLATRIPVTMTLGADTLRMGSAHDKEASDLPTMVKRGLRAKLILQSVVTGQAAIDMDFQPNAPLRLVAGGHSKYPEIPAMRDNLDALLEQVTNLPLGELVNELRHTIKSLDETLKVTREVERSAGQQFQAVAVQAQKTMITGEQAVTAVQVQANATMGSIQRLADTSREVVLQVQPDVVLTLRGTRDAAQAAQLAMGNLAELSAPGAPLRADLETAMRDLSQTARSLRSFSDQLERQPNSLLFGKRAEP